MRLRILRRDLFQSRRRTHRPIFKVSPVPSSPSLLKQKLTSPDPPSTSTSTSTSPPSKPKPRAKTAKTKDALLNLEGDPKVKKRTLNTLAARRYRQKRLDQLEELENELKEARAERDAFKVRCARLEGEVGVLRGLVGK